MRNEANFAFAAQSGVLGLAEGIDGPEVGTLYRGLVTIDVTEAIVRVSEGGGDAAVVVHAPVDR